MEKAARWLTPVTLELGGKARASLTKPQTSPGGKAPRLRQIPERRADLRRAGLCARAQGRS